MNEKDVARLQAERDRLWDLVRFQRGELLEARLITDEEYVALMADHAAVARLNGYDELRRQLKLAQDKASAATANGARAAAADIAAAEYAYWRDAAGQRDDRRNDLLFIGAIAAAANICAAILSGRSAEEHRQSLAGRQGS